MTDSSGNYLLFSPNGEAEILAKVDNSYLDQDTVDISSNLVRNRQEIAFKFPESSYYNSQLAIDKEITLTRPYDIRVIGNVNVFRWRDDPIRIYDNSNIRP